MLNKMSLQEMTIGEDDSFAEIDLVSLMLWSCGVPPVRLDRFTGILSQMRGLFLKGLSEGPFQ